MKVKIGNEVHDSSKEPIMLMLSEDEKYQIGHMGDQMYYCSFPPSLSDAEVQRFMTETCREAIPNQRQTNILLS